MSHLCWTDLLLARLTKAYEKNGVMPERLPVTRLELAEVLAELRSLECLEKEADLLSQRAIFNGVELIVLREGDSIG